MMRVLIDEGVPADVGKAFQTAGHHWIPFEDVVRRGSPDPVVCKVAEENGAVLVAFDRDMKRLAQGNGVSARRFSRLSLIQFRCGEPEAADRLRSGMSFIEHEWKIKDDFDDRRIFIEIGSRYFKSNR